MVRKTIFSSKNLRSVCVGWLGCMLILILLWFVALGSEKLWSSFASVSRISWTRPRTDCKWECQMVWFTKLYWWTLEGSSGPGALFSVRQGTDSLAPWLPPPLVLPWCTCRGSGYWQRVLPFSPVAVPPSSWQQWSEWVSDQASGFSVSQWWPCKDSLIPRLTLQEKSTRPFLYVSSDTLVFVNVEDTSSEAEFQKGS